MDVNAKNGFGGYVGFETNYFMIHNGSVVQYFQSYDATTLCESM